MKYIAKVAGKGLYVFKDFNYWTPLITEAAVDTDAKRLAEKVAAFQQKNPRHKIEVVPVNSVIEDECRRFIRDYECESERTHGEKAAVAAMKTLVFHGQDDLGVLQNSTLRTIQVLQAFQGLLSRMEMRDESDSDFAPALQEQARNE